VTQLRNAEPWEMSRLQTATPKGQALGNDNDYEASNDLIMQPCNISKPSPCTEAECIGAIAPKCKRVLLEDAGPPSPHQSLDDSAWLEEPCPEPAPTKAAEQNPTDLAPGSTSFGSKAEAESRAAADLALLVPRRAACKRARAAEALRYSLLLASPAAADCPGGGQPASRDRSSAKGKGDRQSRAEADIRLAVAASVNPHGRLRNDVCVAWLTSSNAATDEDEREHSVGSLQPLCRCRSVSFSRVKRRGRERAERDAALVREAPVNKHGRLRSERKDGGLPQTWRRSALLSRCSER